MIFIFNLYEQYDIRGTLSESDRCTILHALPKKGGDPIIIRIIYNTYADDLMALSHIHSPYVTQVLEVMQDGRDTIVVEKFIDGLTLRQFLDNGGRLTQYDTLMLFDQLGQALSAVHRAGIIHRDIKPSNIMMHNEAAVLIDFDVARKHDPQQEADTVYMGTKGYAAPEQYGFAQTDNRSDIYSLGVLIRELLGDGYNTAEYRGIVDGCTQFDPANRYQSVEAVLSDIKKCLLPPTDSQSVPQKPAQKKGKRRTRKIMGYLCLSVLCAVILIRFPHEITLTDYILSKLVYLEIVVFLFAPFLNIFKIRNWFPFLKENRWSMVLGIIIYLLVCVVILALTNQLAHALYSEQARSILSVTTVR